MEPNYLKTNELTYELRIRGIVLEDGVTVEEKRKQLRGALSSYSEGRSNLTFTNPYVYMQDVKESGDTCSDLAKLIDNFEGTKTGINYKRICTRLNHLSGRINRIEPPTSEIDGADDDDGENQPTCKDRLISALLSLEGELATRLHKPEDIIDPDPQRNIFHSTLNPDGSTQSQFKSTIVHDWRIRFNGSNSPCELLNFLEDVEALMDTRGVTAAHLFKSAGDLFTDNAKVWYRSNKHRCSNWNELVSLLKQSFLPYNLDTTILKEIDSRSQGEHENVACFIAIQRNLYSRLTVQPSDLDLVEKIREKFNPFFLNQTVLHNCLNVDDLTDFCTRLEKTRQLTEAYVSNFKSNSPNCTPNNFNKNKNNPPQYMKRNLSTVTSTPNPPKDKSSTCSRKFNQAKSNNKNNTEYNLSNNSNFESQNLLHCNDPFRTPSFHNYNVPQHPFSENNFMTSNASIMSFPASNFSRTSSNTNNVPVSNNLTKTNFLSKRFPNYNLPNHEAPNYNIPNYTFPQYNLPNASVSNYSAIPNTNNYLQSESYFDPSGFPSNYDNNMPHNNISTVDSSPRCWNCEDPRHFYFDCPLPRNLFCFGCGRKNVNKWTCGSCSKNGGRGSKSKMDADTSTNRPNTRK
jgi:hypothetical protein